MKYFNGFSLKNEEIFFKEYIVDSDLCVAGFSHGAQKAFDYAYNSPDRIDRLILLSPAFFQNHRASFIRTQLRYFKSDEARYIDNFLQNVIYPSTTVTLHNHLEYGEYHELESLLSYVWNRDKILDLIKRGTTIEVFIGEKDKIVDSQKSFEFFSDVTTTYLLKESGHLLI